MGTTADARGGGRDHDASMTNTHDTSDNTTAGRPGRRLRRWMQVVGAFYLVQFVAMAIVRAPIRSFGPEGALTKASAGDPLAEFLVETWTIFGLEVAAVGTILLIASRRAELARGAIWTVLAIEVGRGLVADSYMIVRGSDVAGYLVWIVIHSAVLATGIFALRAERAGTDPVMTGGIGGSFRS